MPRPSRLKRRLESLERRLLLPEVRRSARELRSLLEPGFIEIAGDGRAYDRRAIIEALAAAPPTRLSLSGFKLRLLAPKVALATFRYSRPGPGGKPLRSLRSSIWRRGRGHWRLAFHQGTLSGT